MWAGDPSQLGRRNGDGEKDFGGGFGTVIKSWRPFPAQQEKGDCEKDFGDLGLS